MSIWWSGCLHEERYAEPPALTSLVGDLAPLRNFFVRLRFWLADVDRVEFGVVVGPADRDSMWRSVLADRCDAGKAALAE